MIRPARLPLPLLLLPCLLVLNACASLPFGPRDTGPTGRLDGNVVPQHYRIEISALPEAERLSGNVAIAVTVMQPTQTITLHGKDLAVSSARVVTADGQSLPARYRQLSDIGVARLQLSTPLPAGTAVIEIGYSAPLNTALEALYKVREQDRDYLFSQFQISSARLLFPGFDEPAFKTPFSISVITTAEHAVIGNMPIRDTQMLGESLQRVQFETTPPLPTYLLALAMGPLDVVNWADIPASKLRPQPVPLRGIAAASKGPRLHYGLQHTAGLLTALEEYFGSPYPFPKLDIIAAPDFAYGAMENVGAIVYREQLMLLDEDAPLQQRRDYALVHAHEMAHQWFGNLVTPEWWDDTWLNESFATWMAAKAAAKWSPSQQFERYIQHRALRAMDLDSLASARQIHQPIASYDDIANAFDGITYSKGGGVLAMFENYLGEAEFRAGVREHMQRYAYGTANGEQFMQSLADGSGKPEAVSSFSSFLDQPGVPQLQVAIDCEDSPQLILAQTRYRPLGSAIADGQRWEIPVCVQLLGTGKPQQVCTFLSEAQETAALASCPVAVMPNSAGAGYYRWNLDDAGWDAVLARLDQLQAAELLSLTDSLDAAFRADQVDIARIAETATQLAAHPAWDASTAPLNVLVSYLDTLASASSQVGLRAWLVRTYGPQLEAIGITGNSRADRRDPVGTTLRRRELVTALALAAQQPELRAQLAQQARDYVGDPTDAVFDSSAVLPDLTGAALQVAVADGGKALGESLLAALDLITDAVVRGYILQATARSPDPELATQVRELTLSERLRDNEVATVLNAQFDEALHRATAWDWLRENFDAVVARTPDWRRGGLVRYGDRFCSGERRAEVDSFFAPRLKQLTGSPRQYAQTLESIDLCIALRAAKQGELDRFFGSDQVP